MLATLDELQRQLKNGRPALAACDPDSSHPAWAVWDGEQLATFGGGSAQRGRIAPTVEAFHELLGSYPLAGIAVEHPNFWAVDTTPQSMEGVYRCRYFVEATCEVMRLPLVPVVPATWQARFVAGELQGRRRKGDTKRAYRAKAQRLWPKLARNEDRCAALGILSWLADEVEVCIPHG